jgi:glyoxylase-like metal-dependent hydrolase (beta-lactamase superfamily II)
MPCWRLSPEYAIKGRELFRRFCAVEVYQDIHQIKMTVPTKSKSLALNPPPGFFLNSYLVRGNDGWLLLDTGWNIPESLETLERKLSEIGIDFADISQIVVTHSHPDHFGTASALMKLCPAELAFHQVESDHIQELRFRVTSDRDGFFREQAKRWRLVGLPDKIIGRFTDISQPYIREIVSCPLPHRTLQSGEIISTGIFNFEVILTAGHTPGHICLYEPERRVFLSGDHILPITTPVISVPEPRFENPLKSYLDSLQAVKDLDVDIVLPAHENIFNDLRQRVEEILLHHDDRKAAVVEYRQPLWSILKRGPIPLLSPLKTYPGLGWGEGLFPGRIFP